MNHGRIFLLAGALCGLLTVAFGAFAAHGLRHQIPAEMLLVFNKGVQYQGLHALALLAVGIMATQRNSRALAISGWSILLGILLFSGSLYLLVLTGNTRLGIITPFGGVSFLVGWLSLTIACWRYSRP